MNCSRKVKYSSEKFALCDIDRIKKLIKKNNTKREKTPSGAYLCSCGSWHLTSKVDKKDEIIFNLKTSFKELKNENNILKQKYTAKENQNQKLVKEISLNLEIIKQKKIINELEQRNSPISIEEIDNCLSF